MFKSGKPKRIILSLYSSKKGNLFPEGDVFAPNAPTQLHHCIIINILKETGIRTHGK